MVAVGAGDPVEVGTGVSVGVAASVGVSVCATTGETLADTDNKNMKKIIINVRRFIRNNSMNRTRECVEKQIGVSVTPTGRVGKDPVRTP